MAFSGDFTPLLHKHTRNLELRDSISIAADRIHRGFDSLEGQINTMQGYLLTDNDARLIIYQAFIEGRIKAIPRNLLPVVHDNYFESAQAEFQPRSLWSLSNAFTSAFKQLAPIKHFEVTAKLGSYLREFQNELNDKEDQIPSLVNCGTDLDNFQMPDDISKLPVNDDYFDQDFATASMDDLVDSIVDEEQARRVAA